MPVSKQPLAERIARVLAGSQLSSNAAGSDSSAGSEVDSKWPDHLDEALAILHTMREPSEKMAAEGDSETWSQMVETAIAETGHRHG